jgi:N6-adenosine-specific RNA methylase IME4/ParB-like chromosome segregation protein Spo0J
MAARPSPFDTEVPLLFPSEVGLITNGSIAVESVKIGQGRKRKQIRNLDGLKKSILDVGLIHPIRVTKSGLLVVGRRRLEAFRELGKEDKRFSKIPAQVWTLDDVKKAERDENIQRDDFTAEEKTEIIRDLLPGEIKKAEERERIAGSIGGKKRHGKGGKTLPTLDGTGKAMALAAGFVGWSRPTAAKAIAILEAVEKAPKKHAKLLEAMNRTGKVNGVFRQLKTAQQAEAIAKEPPPLPEGPFRVIAIDPPWKYDNRADDPSHRAANPYPSLPIETIHEWPIGKMAHDDCVLWLWTTNAHLEQSFAIAKSWGFQYKTMLTWVKDRMGTGDWLRGQTEHCLMCIRGKPTITLTNETTALNGKMRKHSQKPEEFFAMVEKLCPGSKTEIFSREKREGWVCYGDEV